MSKDPEPAEEAGAKEAVESQLPGSSTTPEPHVRSQSVEPTSGLTKFELDFISRHAVESQVLADFVSDWTPPPCHPRGLDDSESGTRAPVFTGPHWTLFFDGSSCKQGAGVEVLPLTPSGEHFKYMVHLDFNATNNMAEYEALIFGLCTALSLGVR
jgi:hypothetical protein